jgi:hypothetical protein
MAELDPTEPDADPAISSLVRGIQEVILWRSPAALFATLVITEGIFYLVYKTDLSFLGAFCLACAIASAVGFLHAVNGPAFDALFFSEHPSDTEEQPNRIREWRELAPYAERLSADFAAFREWLSASPARVLGALFPVFVLGKWPGARAVLFLAAHALLLVPGAVLHPGVRAYVGEIVEHARQAALGGAGAAELQRDGAD